MPTSGAPFRSPPLVRTGPAFSWSCLSGILGLILSIVLLLLLFILSPVFLALRCIGFVKRKSRRWQFDRNICNHAWPLNQVRQPEISVLFLTGDVDLASLNDSLAALPCASIHTGLSSSLHHIDLSADIVRLWNQSQRRIANEKELQTVLNELQTDWNQQVAVHVVNNVTRRGIPYNLLLICCPSNAPNMCLSRLHCMLCNKNIGIELEPQPHFPFLFPVQRFPSIQYSVCAYFRFFTFGMTSMLGLALKRQSAIWKYVEAKCKTPQRNRRRVKSATGNDDTASSTLIEGVPEEIVIERNGSTRGSSLISEAPSSSSSSKRRNCWMAIPTPEIVGRAEKLLRASSFEMMLCLISGALRTFFRDKGLPHPPDIGAVFPFCCRAFMPVAANKKCDTVLLPIQLPTGVEGAIPRLWSIQRRLARRIAGSLPSSLRLSSQLASLCLPSSLLSSAFSTLYSSNSIYVAFYRSTGDFKLSTNASIESMLQFPSLSDSIKASFVFIEHGRELTLCASLCKATFPDPDAILQIFRRDTLRLLDHLSVRLLSLPQSTFLPGMALFNADTLAPQLETNVVQHQQTLPEIKTDSSDVVDEEKPEEKDDYSLEQLYELLATVQNELDGMRQNPQGDRNEHIQRLRVLEERMQRFHECIIKKHGMEGIDLELPDEGSEAGDAVLHVLAPYMDEPSHKGRRYSADLRVKNSGNRKGSRASVY